MDPRERRSSPRKPIKLAAQIDLGKGEAWPCQIADFCAEGLFVRYSAETSRKLDRALANAHALFRDRDRWLPSDERIAILDRTGELMAGLEEELALEAAREGGKPLTDSKVEVKRAIDPAWRLAPGVLFPAPTVP